MLDKHHTFSIQQVSEMTGLSKQVIRKWEDRYGIIHPKRLDNGYRVYSQFEVDLLKKTSQFSEQGYSIKQAATLANDYLHQNESNPISISSNEFDHYINVLEAYGETGNDVMLMQTLQHIYLSHGITDCLQYVVVPFLQRIGDLWCEKKWAEYQEAICSSTIRDFLANLRRTIVLPKEAPLIVGSCLPFERHENPMHILLLQCMLKGYRTIMLGAAPAPSAIESTVLMTKPKYVLLTGSTNAILLDEGASLIKLDQFAGKHLDTKFYIGGAVATDIASKLGLQHIQVANSLDMIFL